MENMLREVLIHSSKTRQNLLEENISLEKLDAIFVRDIKFIYQIYKDLRDSAISLQELDAIFLRDIRSIHQIFVNLREQSQLMRLECTQSK